MFCLVCLQLLKNRVEQIDLLKEKQDCHTGIKTTWRQSTSSSGWPALLFFVWKKSNPDLVISSKICYWKQRHPSPYMVWVLAVAYFDQIQINQEFFPLSQHLFWQSLHLWLVLESLVAVPSWKECPSWDLVNSSIHKSSCPPPSPSSNALEVSRILVQPWV